MTFPRILILLLVFYLSPGWSKDYSLVYLIGKSNFEVNAVLHSKGFIQLSPQSYGLIMDKERTSYVEIFNQSDSKIQKYKVDSLIKIAEEVSGESTLLTLALSTWNGFSSAGSEFQKITHNPNLYRCPMSIYTIAPQKCTLYNDEVFIQWTHIKKNTSTYRVEVTDMFDESVYKSWCKGNFLSFTFNDSKEKNYIFRTRRLLHPDEECQDDILLIRLGEEKSKSVREKLLQHGCDAGGPFSILVEILIYNQMDLFMDANVKWQLLTSFKFLPNIKNAYKKFLVEQKVVIVSTSSTYGGIQDSELFVFEE
jgi:hypothetical protein